MTHMVNDGLGVVQATGQKVAGGVSAVASGIRDGAGAVAHGIRDGIDRDSRHDKSGRLTGVAELTASIAGAVAAFFVSRLVRARLSRHGR